MRRGALAALIVLLALPAPAAAATVRVDGEERDDDPCDFTTRRCFIVALEYDAVAGERNDVTVTPTGAEVTVRDAGAALQPGSGCDRVDDHTVRCNGGRKGAIDNVRVRTGDGDDTAASMARGPTALQGGPGDDRLTLTTAFRSVINGGFGRDTLTGGSGSDFFFTGDDDDVSEPDTMDGGDDARGRYDTVSYGLRDDTVRVDLTGETASGAPGEGDRITNVEEGAGGAGRDTLIGTARGDLLYGDSRADVLIGAGGNDRLAGTGGDDRLRGGAGRDRFLGGRGNDTLLARDGERDRGSGGRGRDRARSDRRLDDFTSVEVRL